MRMVFAAAVAVAALVGCQSDPEGLAVLGYESDSPLDVRMDVIATGDDGLDVPRDLAVDPETGHLWIVSRADDSATIVLDPGGADQETLHVLDPARDHFLEEVSSIAFGQSGTFATCQESRNTYNDQAAGNDFMGPALWPTSLEVFGQTNPAAADFVSRLFGFPVDLGSHLDMQHETPLCTGIAWESANVYWTFDGLNETIDRVDFGQDHGPGYDDHSDGITAGYAQDEIAYEPDVPNHMILSGDRLLIADPAGDRIMALDITTGARGADLPVTEPGTQHYEVNGATLTTFVGVDAGLDQPTGLALVDGILFVTNYGSGYVFAFDAFSGEELGRLNTGRGRRALMGIYATSDEDLWVVDSNDDEVFRIRPALEE